MIYIYISPNLPRNATFRLSLPWSRDSWCQEMFSAPSTDKQTPATTTQSAIYKISDRKNSVLKHNWFLMSYLLAS